MGVTMFGLSSCFYMDAGLYGKGSNCTLNAIANELLHNHDRISLDGDGELRVGLDNTAGDNKNSYCWSFFGYLVHLGIFKRVRVLCLLWDTHTITRISIFRYFGIEFAQNLE